MDIELCSLQQNGKPHPVHHTHKIIHNHTHTHTRAHMHTHAHTHTRTRTHTRAHTHAHAHTHTHTHTHTRIHIIIRVHAHTLVSVLVCESRTGIVNAYRSPMHGSLLAALCDLYQGHQVPSCTTPTHIIVPPLLLLATLCDLYKGHQVPELHNAHIIPPPPLSSCWLHSATSTRVTRCPSCTTPTSYPPPPPPLSSCWLHSATSTRVTRCPSCTTPTSYPPPPLSSCWHAHSSRDTMHWVPENGGMVATIKWQQVRVLVCRWQVG